MAGPATRISYGFKMLLGRSAQQAASRLERTEMAVLIAGEKAHQLVSLNGELS